MRRRSRRWAPPPSARAEVGGERADVGARRAGRPRSGSDPGSTGSPTSKRWTVTGRGLRSTSMPSRASSWRRFPSTFTADTIGGICRMSPVRRSRLRPATVVERRRRPCPSVPVTSPRRRAWRSRCRARPRPCSASPGSPRYCSSRVTLPTPSSSTPVASGSRVPEWPTLRVPSRPRALATTSWLVQPGRLVDDGQAVGARRSTGHRVAVDVESSASTRRSARGRPAGCPRPGGRRAPRRRAGTRSSGVRFTRAWRPTAVRSRCACLAERLEHVLVVVVAAEAVVVDDRPVEDASQSTDMIVTSSSRSSSIRSSSSARISWNSWLSRAVRG